MARVLVVEKSFFASVYEDKDLFDNVTYWLAAS